MEGVTTELDFGYIRTSDTKAAVIIGVKKGHTYHVLCNLFFLTKKSGTSIFVIKPPFDYCHSIRNHRYLAAITAVFYFSMAKTFWYHVKTFLFRPLLQHLAHGNRIDLSPAKQLRQLVGEYYNDKSKYDVKGINRHGHCKSEAVFKCFQQSSH